MNRESNRRSMRSLRDGQDSSGETLRQKEKRKKDQIKRTSSENAADKASVSSRDGKGTRRQYQEE